MEFDQKEETPFNIPEKKKTDKKQLAIYIAAGVVSLSSLIYGYASYQANYFKDMEIKNLKTQLEDANTKLLRIEVLENQVKELEISLATKNIKKLNQPKKILSNKKSKKTLVKIKVKKLKKTTKKST